MPALTSYLDFVKATKTHRVSSPDKIQQEAVKNTYFIKNMIRGSDLSRTFQSSQSIKEDISLSNTGTFQFYNPNASFSPSDQDTLKTVNCSWRFALTHYGWNEDVMELNNAPAEDVWINYKKSKTASAEVDAWNGMETALWAPPDYSTMEAGGGDAPPAYSIPTFVNEYSNGVPIGWTGSQIETIDASVESRWRPQHGSYTAGAADDRTSGLFAAFDKMFLDVKFETPPGAQAFEMDNYAKMRIVTSRGGMTMYKGLCRAANDRFVSPQDPAYPGINYEGVRVEYASELNTSILDLANAAAFPESAPRFYFLNFKYLFPTWHVKNYMRQQDPQNGAMGSPFQWVVYFKTFYNVMCTSRQRQGIVYPA